jgi:hypothetical protein
LRGQLLRYPDLPRTIKELSEYCFPRRPGAIDRKGMLVWHNDEPCIAFGKYAKQGPVPLRGVDPKYLHWICENNFPLDVKEILRAALQGIYPMKPAG